MDPTTVRTQLLRLIVHLLPPLAVAGIGGRTTVQSVRTWYPTHEEPPLSPPNGVFGLVRGVLSLLMGIADWRVAEAGGASDVQRDAVSAAYSIDRVQLVLAWTTFATALNVEIWRRNR